MTARARGIAWVVIVVVTFAFIMLTLYNLKDYARENRAKAEEAQSDARVAASAAEALARQVRRLGGKPVIDVDDLPTIEGPMGPIGPQGIPGLPGQDGQDGQDGKDGTDGEDGAVGPAGPSGADGAPGPAGPPGEQGPAGPQGEQGPQGPAGPTCPDGYTPQEVKVTDVLLWACVKDGAE